MRKSTKPFVKRDHYAEVTASILAELEKGDLPWWKPDWDRAGYSMAPVNAVSGHAYRGFNHLYLMAVAHKLSGDKLDPRFMTFNQAKAKGWNVKKGEHGHPVLFFKRVLVGQNGPEEAKGGRKGGRILDKLNKDVDKEAFEKLFGKSEQPVEQQSGKYVWFLRSFTVFHASQIEGIPEIKLAPVDWDVNAKLREMRESLEGQGMTFQQGGDSAFYSPRRDQLNMPPQAAFETPEGYAATLAHEMGHATGHIDRLNRKTLYTPKTDVEGYAKEELVAEMASAMLCSTLGIGYDTERHASYIDHWIKAMQGDKKLAVVSAGRAAAAVDYLIDQVPGLAAEIRRNRAQCLGMADIEEVGDEIDVATLAIDQMSADVETAMPNAEFIANADEEWRKVMDEIDVSSFVVDDQPAMRETVGMDF